MATADGPIGKMLNFMQKKKSQAVIDTDLIMETGHLTPGDEYSAPFSSVREEDYDNKAPNMRVGGEKKVPIEGDEVKISKRRAKDDAVRLKHKGYKSDDDGVYSVYKAKKYKHANKKKV